MREQLHLIHQTLPYKYAEGREEMLLLVFSVSQKYVIKTGNRVKEFGNYSQFYIVGTRLEIVP